MLNTLCSPHAFRRYRPGPIGQFGIGIGVFDALLFGFSPESFARIDLVMQQVHVALVLFVPA